MLQNGKLLLFSKDSRQQKQVLGLKTSRGKNIVYTVGREEMDEGSNNRGPNGCIRRHNQDKFIRSKSGWGQTSETCQGKRKHG